MKNWMKHILIFLILSGVLGAAVMLTGLIPVSASSGHWAITEWILHFSMGRSIKTHSLNVKVPDLMTASMVQKGAGHFEIGCKQCHGRPGRNNFLGDQMTPEAPKLSDKIKKWKEKELFQIVKHGVKFTAMPAWPNLKRDDEVWAVVAFLQKLPGMSSDEYEKLTLAKTDDAKIKACANCHGIDGNGRETAAFPKLAGQNYEYLKSSLLAYANGARNSGIMELAVAPLSKEMIESFSRYYSSQRPKPVKGESGHSASISNGKAMAHNGVPDQKVASCVSCHGPHSDGRKINRHYPKLSGQHAEYLSLQMKLILADKRGGTKFLPIMHKALSTMTDEQIRDVAFYYQSLNDIQ